MNNYPLVVQRIHNEFDTASESALKQANSIINGNKHLLAKASLLEKVGFLNSICVKKAAHVKMSNSIADLILYYRVKYPNNKFITEIQVLEINKKYNLTCAPIDRYKGFVPAVKLEVIHSFNVDMSDKKPNKVVVKSFAYTLVQKNLIKEFKRLYPDGVIDKTQYYEHTSYVNINDCSLYIKSYDEINNDTLFICAPKMDMDLKGLSKIGAIFQSVTTVKVPDPIVLQPVKGGFLIVAAWGDEASDEIVVNQTMN